MVSPPTKLLFCLASVLVVDALVSSVQTARLPTTLREPVTTRRIHKVETPTRLPVWPVLNGLVYTALDALNLKAQAAWLEDRFGGRVAPMMLDTALADPFVLLVHHRHAFEPWDPVRPVFRAVLPEGFPAHPHIGFETVTMTLRGGLTHRDSFGVREVYADGDVQWLTAGRGVLHEEMWHGTTCELYQLWLNLPQSEKAADPRTVVLKTTTTTPKKDDDVAGDDHTSALAIDLGGALGDSEDAEGHSGSFRRGNNNNNNKRVGPDRPDVKLLRLRLDPGAEFRTSVPPEATVLAYCRRGKIAIGGDELNRHSLAYTSKGASDLCIEAVRDAENNEEADVLLLCGLPLGEPVVASGTWVVSSERELELADQAYRAGKLGVPWDHALSDEDWLAWVQRHPPAPSVDSAGRR